MDKRIPWKYQFWHFQVAKFLMSFSEPTSVFLQILSASSVSRKITTLYFFRSNVYNFARKGPMKVQILRLLSAWIKIRQILVIFETRNWFFFKFGITLQYHETITPLYFLSWNFIYFQQKQSIKVKICWISPKQSKIWNCALS